jgi:hypothetical protein
MKTFTLLGALAVIGVGTSTLMVPAVAGGLIGDIVNGFVPGAGTALDSLNDRIRKGQSDQSFYNQVTGGYWNGIGEAAPQASPAPPPPVMGNRCATPVGAYFGPFNPVGMPCGANTPYGFYSGTVIQ